MKQEIDEDHIISQKRLRELMAADELNGVKCSAKTLYNILHKLHLYLNPGVCSNNRDDYILLFSGCDKEDTFSDNDNDADFKTRMSGLQFNHIFSYKELDSLIYAVKTSNEISQSDSSKLINKLKLQSSKYYRCSLERIKTYHEFAPANKEVIHKNLKVLQQAIDEKVQASFYFNAYTRRNTLKKQRENKYVVNPYFTLSYSGRFYLIANTPPYQNVSIYRIDLMSEVSVHQNTSGCVSALPAESVDGLDRVENPDDFALRHLYMFYDEPVRTRLWVDNTRYTLVHDWFGDSFEFIQSVDNNRDEIEVECSPNAMANWAMQFSKYVEVKYPSQVRELVVNKINAIAQKYSVFDQVDI